MEMQKDTSTKDQIIEKQKDTSTEDQIMKKQKDTSIEDQIIMDTAMTTQETDQYYEVYMRDTTSQDFPIEWDKGGQIGSGAFGDVFLVVDTTKPNVQLFVVKEIRISSLKRNTIMKDFKNETDILLLLGDHHRIVPFYGYSVTDTLASIFMGYMRMGSLSSFYRNNDLSEDVCLRFTNQILEGLAYLHDHGVIHRDIKGTNILLEDENNIRLTDFGISKVVNDSTTEFTMDRGSFRWMAPEVCNAEIYNKYYSFEADIWSLGCTVIEMMTRDFPYSSIKEPYGVIFKVGKGESPEFPENISKRMKQLLQATFVVTPSERMSAKKLIKFFFNNDRQEASSELTSEPLRSEYSETELLLQNINCTKNPGHLDFIPVHSFTLQHLPETSENQRIYDLIKTVAELTVKIDVKKTSSYRLKFWPGSSVKYPYHDMENRSKVRTGSGLVYSVKIHPVEEYSQCPCQKCVQEQDPSNIWGEVEIMTATHVVHDYLEAKNTSCRLFYDNTESEEFNLDNFSIVVSDKVKNWTLLKCTTCNNNILDKVIEKLGCFENLRSETYLNPDSAKLGFIVSHPHGGPKQISIGKLKDTKILHKTWSQLTYTICTCPGSSGAYVHIVGSNCPVWHFPHVHTGALNNEVNYSSIGYCSSQQVVKHLVKPKAVVPPNTVSTMERDMKSGSIPKDWEKGKIICSGKFSKVYTLVDPNNSSDTKFIVKEKVLFKDQIKNSAKLYSQCLNEFHCLLYCLKKQHERLAPYYGFVIKTDCIIKFLGHMSLGSLSSYYKRNGPINELKCFLYTKQVLEGLEYLHRHKVFHMNIRGKNIYLQTETQVKISGFEFSQKNAKAFIKEDIGNPGNIRWTSPQQINPDFFRDPKPIRHYYDVWSLGCTIVEMLTANVPYGYYRTITAVVMKIGKGEPPKIHKPVQRYIQEILDIIFDTRSTASACELLEKMAWVRSEQLTESENISTDFLKEHYDIFDSIKFYHKDIVTEVEFERLQQHLHIIFSRRAIKLAMKSFEQHDSIETMWKISYLAQFLPKEKFIEFVAVVRLQNPYVAGRIKKKYKELSGKELTTIDVLSESYLEEKQPAGMSYLPGDVTSSSSDSDDLDDDL